MDEHAQELFVVLSALTRVSRRRERKWSMGKQRPACREARLGVSWNSALAPAAAAESCWLAVELCCVRGCLAARAACFLLMPALTKVLLLESVTSQLETVGQRP